MVADDALPSWDEVEDKRGVVRMEEGNGRCTEVKTSIGQTQGDLGLLIVRIFRLLVNQGNTRRAPRQMLGHQRNDQAQRCQPLDTKNQIEYPKKSDFQEKNQIFTKSQRLSHILQGRIVALLLILQNSCPH